MERVRVSIRRKLLFATLTPLCAAILLCWFIGATLITDRVFRQAQQKVRAELNSARKVYLDEIGTLTGIVRVAGLSPALAASLTTQQPTTPPAILRKLMHSEHLSFLNVLDNKGVVRYRSTNPTLFGENLAADPLVARALAGEPAGGTQVYSVDRLQREAPQAAAKAAVTIKETPRARPTDRKSEERGLVLVAAAPLRGEDGTVSGVLQAGLILNGDTRLVDTITRIVHEQEAGGTATLFLNDVRIATNVRDAAGERAVGSLMSNEVARVVLETGASWSDRAFVLKEWFLSAYEPIRDPSGAVIGALYVGLPEQPLLQMRTNLNLIFGGVLLFVTLIGVVLSGWLSRRLAQPVRALAEGARRMAAGEHISDINVATNDEIGLLADEFNTMAREVSTLNRTLEQKVARRTTQLEEKNRELLAAQKELARSERLAGIGMLAAGVAHEINNPLAIIRGNTELLQDEIPAEDEAREEVEAIMVEIGRIERIVANLKVFSRSGIKRLSRFSMGELLDSILDRVGHQIPLDNYRVEREYWGKDCEIEGDEDQLRQVFTNLVVNGLQAMEGGGVLSLDIARYEARSLLCVTVADQGTGIAQEHMEKLFTPFFSTKQRGTGLGLAVSYGIIRDHGGEIRAMNRDGKGAIFTVTLPFRQGPSNDLH